MADSRAPAPRLRSLDALRGFDMLWIIGLAEFFKLLAEVTDVGWLDSFALQNDHVKWEGLRLHDLILPLFMFLSGMSVPYALGQRLSRGMARGSVLAGVWRRVLILVLLGIVYNHGLQFDFAHQRYASVLGQIGIGYGIAATIYLFTKTWKGRAAWALFILLGIAALQLLFPVPGVGAGVLTPEGVVNGWFDRGWLPGRLHGVVFDPEGWLCTISASALTLGGVMTGDYVKGWGRPSHTAAGHLLLAGTALLFAGWLCWHFGYPPIKSAWNSTFNLLAAGISIWTFAAFYLAIEFHPNQKLSFPLEVIGMNPLTIYLLEGIVSFPDISHFFFGGIASYCGKWEEVVLILGVLLIEWLLLYFLWKKRAFLRV
ncbi:DUF5009 domain-containing protein [Haloferula sp. BvORR071]|uniref:acyltransferase family protein n=1 Tax=Haloferula sp. BvORR071 TaxID=1396141 RepID=UPI00054F9FD3|nr:DUF5009 domain-containing protein [Haloferula sp. BvORR071]